MPEATARPLLEPLDAPATSTGNVAAALLTTARRLYSQRRGDSTHDTGVRHVVLAVVLLVVGGKSLVSQNIPQ